eukprot:81718-Prymnesium_polylepis.1
MAVAAAGSPRRSGAAAGRRPRRACCKSPRPRSRTSWKTWTTTRGPPASTRPRRPPAALRA